MGLPSTNTSPLVGWAKPATIMSVVVLPEPLGPRRVKKEPRSMVTETSRTATTGPKVLVSA